MKIRSGFVSNSSSSSFVCEISGEAYEGYDGEYNDCTYVCCENGHEFAGEELPELMKLIEEGEDEDGLEIDRYDLPEKYCPICNGSAKPVLIERIKGLMTSYSITVEDLK